MCWHHRWLGLVHKKENFAEAEPGYENRYRNPSCQAMVLSQKRRGQRWMAIPVAGSQYSPVSSRHLRLTRSFSPRVNPFTVATNLSLDPTQSNTYVDTASRESHISSIVFLSLHRPKLLQRIQTVLLTDRHASLFNLVANARIIEMFGQFDIAKSLVHLRLYQSTG